MLAWHRAVKTDITTHGSHVRALLVHFCTFQIFPINGTCVNARRLKIVFETSSDFFGRITIYVLDVVGTREWNQQTS